MYARPVLFVADVSLFVADVSRALHFYVDQLGFERAWHESDGAGKVAQVNRGGCEIILCQSADQKDKARLFVELTDDGLAALRGEIVATAIASEKSCWGYDVIRIEDPDAN
ncbi:MAG TPA: VOC family protein [Humisphaera sp.]|jgi:catechol 2,3-dioxygenase-like lactoylglutathione lyase family enzyme|nr:VOC family protein [Humisphaera sp.]